MRLRACYFISLLLLFSNCKDVFDFKSIGNAGLLAVNGTISDGPGPYELTLGLTSLPNRLPDPLSGAFVTMYDDEGHQENYVDKGKGKYELQGEIIKGTKGRSYSLEIKLADGTTYRSSNELMPNLQATDSSYFTVTKEKAISEYGIPIDQTTVKIILNTVLPKINQEAYFRWGTDEVYQFFPTCVPNPFGCPLVCYVYLPVSNTNLQVVKTSDYTDPHLNGLVVKSKVVDYTFSEKHYFNVTQYAINEKTYNYWKKVQTLTARTGSIFDTPPANIQGNIYNINDPDEQVYGYFEASAQKISRIGVSRGFIPGQMTTPCNYDPGLPNASSYTLQCRECLSNPGGTNEAPAWFK